MDISLLSNPFTKIAGWKALVVGVAGIPITALLLYFSGWHYVGAVFAFGSPASFLMILFSQFAIWLVTSSVFHILGLRYSKSETRVVDVFGTMAFAQLPYAFTIAVRPVGLLEGWAREVERRAVEATPTQEFLLAGLGSALSVITSLIVVGILLWVMIMMFNAVKVSCNLRDGKLLGVFIAGIVISEIILRAVIVWVSMKGFFAAN